MTQKDYILQELKDLQSPLADFVPQNTYLIPAGYFEGLAEQVLSRIRAMESATAVEELGHLSPLLSQLPKNMPYAVPAGYFEGLESTLISAAMYGNQEVKEELNSISPLLSGLKKEMPYSVPAGYFENLARKEEPVARPAAKVVSLGSRRWFRYAAAAVVTGVIILAGFIYLKPGASEPGASMAKFEKKILKEIKKTSDTGLTEFVKQFDDAGLNGEENAFTDKGKEVKELLKDIPETDLKQFLDETADTETSTEESLLMN